VQDELIQSKETINQLRNSILIKDSLIDSLKSEISDKNMTIEQLNFSKVNSENDFNIAQSKLSTEQERLGAITTSTSWRITYPVRLCVRTLRQGISIPIKALQKIFVKNKK
jgi:predicted  nucleic acid-binding Zn-ribbon protein